eukprot:2976963-Prymnesium_polylepis.1
MAGGGIVPEVHTGIHALRLGKVREACRTSSQRVGDQEVAVPMPSLPWLPRGSQTDPRVLRANQAALHALRALRP